jgi:hypothetical protein
MARPSVRHIPVVYLTAIGAVAAVFIIQASARLTPTFLIRMVNGTILAHLALSLLINIYATSLIALKAWCVHFDRVTGTHSTYCALVDNTMRAYIQEIPQVAEGKRCRYPNP